LLNPRPRFVAVSSRDRQPEFIPELVNPCLPSLTDSLFSVGMTSPSSCTSSGSRISSSTAAGSVSASPPGGERVKVGEATVSIDLGSIGAGVAMISESSPCDEDTLLTGEATGLRRRDPASLEGVRIAAAREIVGESARGCAHSRQTKGQLVESSSVWHYVQ